ncbi:MAG: (Fe-S)-binding protein, partial [Candidatus Krumholzibacteriaceae bacterium]
MTIPGVTLLVLFAAVLAAFGLIVRLLYRILRAAKPENRFARWGERIKAVLIYVAAQARVLAKPAGLGHFIIFWGFIFITIGTLDHMLFQIVPGFGLERLVGRGAESAFLWLQDIFGILVIGAIVVSLVRRFALKPARLRIDDPAAPRQAAFILVLIFVLILFMYGVKGTEILRGSERLTRSNAPVSFSAARAMRGWGMNLPVAGGVFSWGHNLIILFFLLYIPFSKHIHILGAIPNVFFRNLGPMGSLGRMNFEDESAEKFGVSELRDFTWKQLLDLYACTECGRCQVACPAYTTQKPLSPFRVIHRLRAQLMRDRGGLFESGAGVLAATPVIPENVSEDEIWACTTCGACMQECPPFIEHVQKVVDFRRYLVLTESRFPAEMQPVFRNMEVNYNPWAIGYTSRADWAAGLGVPLASEKRSFDVLYWVGCSGSFDQRGQKVARAFVTLMQTAGVDFAILGTEERCCGETARRMGNEYLAQTLIQANIETLKKYTFKKIVTTCPHGLNTFLVEYPQFGLSVPVMHHSEFLLGLVSDKKLSVRRLDSLRGAFHDSCYLGRYNGRMREPRALLARSARRVSEFKRHGLSSFCCGAGGGRMWMEEKLGVRINEERVRELLGLGVDHVFTACPFCLTMFEDGLKALNREDV